MISAKRTRFATSKYNAKPLATTVARQPILPLIGDALKRLLGIKA